MEKDMKTVKDFENELQRRILLGQCFNNASTLLAGSFSADVKIVTAKAVFDFAESLFNEGMDRDWLNYGKIEDTHSIEKKTGKVTETPSSAVGGVPVTLTEKEGKEMGVDFPETKEDYEENNEVVI